MQIRPEQIIVVARSVVEPLLALMLAFLLTVLATLPFIPMTTRVEVPLQKLEGRMAIEEVDLLRRIENRGLAAKPIQIKRAGNSNRLVLIDFPDSDNLDTLRETLDDAGYESRGLIVDTRADIEGLLSGGMGKLPILLSIQAVIFTVAGLLVVTHD